jgi:hypothetical protein
MKNFICFQVLQESSKGGGFCQAHKGEWGDSGREGLIPLVWGRGGWQLD